MKAKRKRWGVHLIAVETSEKNPGFVSWKYANDNSMNWGGHIEVSGENGDFVTVSTDDYEGSAHFPSALIGEVIKRLRAIQRPKK